MKDVAVNTIRARSGDDVNDTACGAAKLGICAIGYDLKLLNGIKGNVNRGALSSELLAKETVVIVAAVETYVVEGSTLAGKCDFVTVRSLYNTNAGRKAEQIFKLASQNRCVSYSCFVECGTGFSFHNVDGRSGGYGDALFDSGNLHRQRQGHGLTNHQAERFRH